MSIADKSLQNSENSQTRRPAAHVVHPMKASEH